MEGVGQANAVKWDVFGGIAVVLILYQVVIDGFDVNSGNVVRQQYEFIGVNFVFVFVCQLLWRNEPALQQPCDECACACEWVNDVDVLTAQCLVEFRFEDVVHTVNNEVHHFDWGIDDTQAVGHAFEGISKKFIIQFNDNFLFALRVVYPCCSLCHAGVKTLQGIGFFGNMVTFKHIEHGLHGKAHRVVLRKTITLKQRIKNRFGDEVLCQHFNDFTIGDGVIQIIADFFGKCVKCADFGCIGGRIQYGLNARDVGVGNFGNVIRPVFPVVAIATFFHDLGDDGAFDFADIEFQFALGVYGVVVCATNTKTIATCVFVFGHLDGFAVFILLFFDFGGDGVGDGNDFHF